MLQGPRSVLKSWIAYSAATTQKPSTDWGICSLFCSSTTNYIITSTNKFRPVWQKAGEAGKLESGSCFGPGQRLIEACQKLLGYLGDGMLLSTLLWLKRLSHPLQIPIGLVTGCKCGRPTMTGLCRSVA